MRHLTETEFLTLDDAYQAVLYDLVTNSTYRSFPRGLEIKEILNYQFTVLNPSNGKPIKTANKGRNKIIAQYTKNEFELYDSETVSAEEYARAASFWKKIQNPDGTINSAYGWLIFGRKVCGDSKFSKTLKSPWKWAIDSLKKDVHSRQAVIHLNTPSHLWHKNKDVVCTMFLQLFIRDDGMGKKRLHLTAHMRSNDVVKGLVYDMVYFSSLIHRAVKELRKTYPGLKAGYYTHSAGSMHLYEKDRKLAESMLIK